MAPFQLRQAVIRFLVKSGWSLPVAPCQSRNLDGPGCSGREFAVIIFPQYFYQNFRLKNMMNNHYESFVLGFIVCLCCRWQPSSVNFLPN